MTPDVAADAPAEVVADVATEGRCEVLQIRSEVRTQAIGWREVSTWKVMRPASAPCTYVTFHLPSGVVLTDWGGSVAAFKRPNHPLDAARLSVDVSPSGDAVGRVLLPELEAGDLATLHLVRDWRYPTDWHRLPEPAKFYEVLFPAGLAVQGPEFTDDGRWYWVEDGDAVTPVSVPHPWAHASPEPVPVSAERGLPLDAALARVATLKILPEAAFGRMPLAGDAALAFGVTDPRGWRRTLLALTEGGPDAEAARDHAAPQPDLQSDTPTWSGEVRIGVGGPDPRRFLVPGGGLVWRERSRAVWAQDEGAHATFVPFPADVVGSEAISEGCVMAPQATYGAWIVGGNGVRSCAFTLVRALDDAWDTHSPHLVGAAVHGGSQWTHGEHTAVGSLAIEREGWRLGALADAELLSTEARLGRELLARRLARSFPEPGLSKRSKLGLEGWDFVAAVRPLLREQVVIRDDLTVVPGQPRPLHAARAGGVVSPEEAASIAALYLQQEHIEADVVLVHPGPGPAGATPLGFTEAVVRIRYEGGEAWLDLRHPGPEPFALREELRGRPGWAPEGAVTVPR